VTDSRRAILDAFEAALDAARPDQAVRRVLVTGPSGELQIHGRSLGHVQPVEAIAIGKAAVAMMSGALDVLGDNIARGFVITKDGHIDRELPGRIELHEAAHPVLDERSVTATHRLLEWVAGIPREAIVLCLISGGGSALLEEPVDGVSLDDFQEMTRLLLRAGADIYQLNAVRSQVSKVKGGGLRAAIPANRVVSLLLSDVIGNDPTVIASGPTVPARSTRTHAIDVVARLGLTDKIPASIMRLLESRDARRPVSRPEDVVEVVADNASALEAAATWLSDAGYHAELDHDSRAGEARDVAREWVMHLRDVPIYLDAVVAGGELTVTVTGDGTGGRNTEFALAAAMELERLGIAGWTVASLATDGQDGPTDVAGAITDKTVPSRLREQHIDPIAALRNNDSCPPLEQIGVVVKTGPTGTNVNDLYFAVRNRTP
jgi:glycerate 2-kinase